MNTPFDIKTLKDFNVSMIATDGTIDKYELLEKYILSVGAFSTRSDEYFIPIVFMCDSVGYTHRKLISMFRQREEFNFTLTTHDRYKQNFIYNMFENVTIAALEYPERHLRSNDDIVTITAILKYKILKIKYDDTNEVFPIKDINYRSYCS